MFMLKCIKSLQNKNMPATQERITTNPDLLKEAGAEFYAVCGQVDDALEAKGIDLDRISPEAYWFTVADATNRLIEEKYSSIDSLSPKGTALELIAATPYALLGQQKLNAHESGRMASSELSDKEAIDLIYYSSYYSDLIKRYSTSHPDTRAPQLNESLSEVVRRSGLTKHIDAIRPILAEKITASQHEHVTTQVLSKLGEAEAASTEEDLQGIDIRFLPEGGSYRFPIDVKSSVNAVRTHSKGKADKAYVSSRGVLVMWSHLTDEILQGRFTLTDEEAAAHAAKLAPIIDHFAKARGLRELR